MSVMLKIFSRSSESKYLLSEFRCGHCKSKSESIEEHLETLMMDPEDTAQNCFHPLKYNTNSKCSGRNLKTKVNTLIDHS